MSKDLFSNHASQYAAFRPTYPNELYGFIFSYVKNFDLAWDAGTGNGQVSRSLASRFKKVLATDISAKQLANAHAHENISYSIAGEVISFPEKSFDLITVGQAIHWFDRKKFYEEVYRVLKPNGLLAVWGYSLLSVHPEIDLLLSDFYVNVIGSYWDSERKLVDEQYKTIDFPFQEIKVPDFSFSFQWTMREFEGYVNTWSSVQKFIREKKSNPVDKLITQIQPYWSAEKMTATFPLFLRLGKLK